MCIRLFRVTDQRKFSVLKLVCGEIVWEIDFCTLLNGFSTLVNFGKKCLKKHIDKGQKNNFDIFTSIFVISMWKNHVLFSHRYNFLILSFNV